MSAPWEDFGGGTATAEPTPAPAAGPWDDFKAAAPVQQSSGPWDDFPKPPPPSLTPASDAVAAATGQIYGSSGPTTAEAVGMEKGFAAAHPQLYPWIVGAAKAVEGMVPTSLEQAKQMVKPPIQGAAGEENVQKFQEQLVQDANQWGQAITGQLGPEAQGQTVVGTALQAAPLLHLPFAESPLRAPLRPGYKLPPPPELPEAAPPVAGTEGYARVEPAEAPPETPAAPYVYRSEIGKLTAEAMDRLEAQRAVEPPAAAEQAPTTRGKTLAELAAEGAGEDLTAAAGKAQRRTTLQNEVDRLTNLIRGTRAFGSEAEQAQIPAMEARIKELNDEILGKTEGTATAAEPAPPTEAARAPEVAKPAPVAGPALIDPEGKVIVQGEIGQTHADLMKEAMGTPQEVAAVEALGNDAQHAFVDTENNVLNRDQAATAAVDNGQAPEGTTRLQSEQLKPEAQPRVAEPPQGGETLPKSQPAPPTPPVTEGPIAKLPPPETPGTQPPPVSGINNDRLYQIHGEDAIIAGKGRSASAWKQIGQADTRDPYAVLENARKQGIATPADVANLRTEHQRLLNDARNAYGTPQYGELAKRAVDMANAIKGVAHGPASDVFRALQEQDIPRYESPADFDNIIRERMNRESTPSETATFKKITDDVAARNGEAVKAATDAQTKLRQSRPRAAKEPMKFEDAADYIRKQLVDLTKDCGL